LPMKTKCAFSVAVMFLL